MTPTKEPQRMHTRKSVTQKITALAFAGLAAVSLSACGDIEGTLNGGAIEPTSSPTSSSAPASTAGSTVESTAGSADCPTYKRVDCFGKAWADVDQNGCDTRNDILARDLTNVTKASDGCTVLTGTLDDPYTGKVIQFKRGKGTSTKVQIDHIVALKDAYDQGAGNWTPEARLQFANDPDNLIAADGSANMGKGAKGITQWLPENTAFQCNYVQRYIKVQEKYHLQVTDAERAVESKVC